MSDLKDIVRLESQKLETEINSIIPDKKINIQIINIPDLYANYLEKLDKIFFDEDLKCNSYEFKDIIKKKTFFGTFAHDKKNPLAAIIGNQDFEDIPVKLRDKSYYITSIAYNKEILDPKQGSEILKILIKYYESIISKIGYKRILLHTDNSLIKKTFEEENYTIHRFYKNYYNSPTKKKPARGAFLLFKELKKTKQEFSQEEFNKVKMILNNDLGNAVNFLLNKDINCFLSINSFNQKYLKKYFIETSKIIKKHHDNLENGLYFELSKLIGMSIKDSVEQKGGKQTGLNILREIFKDYKKNVQITEDVKLNKNIINNKKLNDWINNYLFSKDLMTKIMNNIEFALEFAKKTKEIINLTNNICDEQDVIFRSNTSFELGGPSGILKSHHQMNTSYDNLFLINLIDFYFRKKVKIIPEKIKYIPLINKIPKNIKSSGFIYTSIKNDPENRVVLECSIGQGDIISEGGNSIYIELKNGKPSLVRKTFKDKTPQNLILPELMNLDSKEKKKRIQEIWKDRTNLIKGVRSPHNLLELEQLFEIAKKIDENTGSAKIEYFIQYNGDIILTQLDPSKKYYDQDFNNELKKYKNVISRTPFVNRPFNEFGKVIAYNTIVSETYENMKKLNFPFFILINTETIDPSLLDIEKFISNKNVKGLIFDSAISVLSHDTSYFLKSATKIKGEFFLDKLNILTSNKLSQKIEMIKYGKSIYSPLRISNQYIRTVSDGLRGIVTLENTIDNK